MSDIGGRMITINKDSNKFHRLCIEGNWVLLDGVAITTDVEVKNETKLKFKDGSTIILTDDKKSASSIFILDESQYCNIKSVVTMNERT
jgi:hypothetical protein